MGLFGRRRPTPSGKEQLVTADELAEIGRLRFGGDSPYPMGLANIAQLDALVVRAHAGAGYPAGGSPEWTEMERRLLGELLEAADEGGDWAVVGGFCLATNLCSEVPSREPGFQQLMDRFLVVARNDGVAWAAVPPFALERWHETRGSDGLSPKDWPAALETKPVPDPALVVPVEPLGPGQTRLLARRSFGANGMRDYHAERRADGMVVAMIEGVVPEDQSHKRWEWPGVSAKEYEAFLQELGDRLVTPTEWAHADLLPYFPCRQRSRAEMRELARDMA